MLRRIFKTVKARIVYSSDYIYGLPAAGHYQTFDIMRFKKIRDKLVKNRLVKRRHILLPDMCSYNDLRLVHTEEYIRKIKDSQYAAQILNLDIIDLFSNSILEYFRAVTGGTLMAAAFTLKWRVPVFNLGGGYHHAHADKGEGFCLINDVAIAIEKFRKLQRGKKFMIIDLDYHQGNGTLLYFQDDPDVFTFSMHADTWVEIESAYNMDILLPSACSDKEYLDILEKELTKSCINFNPDMVFFIAGSDVYEKDTIGDMNLSREGVLNRNLFVYNLVRKRKLPLVIVAGGGYGQDSWEVYYDFIEACMKNNLKTRIEK
jgi:acetoin utilization deacetylase AcuC-like enzyme